MKRREVIIVAFIIPLVGMLFASISLVHADTVDELKAQIEDRNAQIAQIEKEIAAFEAELNKVGAEKDSLQKAIQTLDIARNKLLSDIKLTETRIAKTALDIDELTIEIANKESRIDVNSEAIGEAIRSLQEVDNQSLVEALLAYSNLSSFWDQLDSIESFQASVLGSLATLHALKDDLESQKVSMEKKRRELAGFRDDLSGQKKVVEVNKSEKAVLLTKTKNKESEYQELLDERVARKEAFEQELREFEAQLRYEIDPSKIPPVGEGILLWPLEKIQITQYFGNTSFATANPQVYNGKGHNGVDFGTSPGSKVFASLSGIVTGTGDTDTVCPGASYGKWVLIKHNNGLSTLYAHLSHIGVSSGQSVTTGDTIGFSGNTGYSTGPHLHYSVFASQGVQVGSLKSRVCAGTYTIPLADQRAYLNPLSYL